MITVDRLTPSDDECEAYECDNRAQFLIGGISKNYDDDKLLCEDCVKKLVDKLMEEVTWL